MLKKKAPVMLLASTLILSSCAYDGKSKNYVQVLENLKLQEIQKGIEEIIKSNSRVIQELEQRQQKQWLRFVVVGDTISNQNLVYRELLAKISGLDPSPEFIVNLGDFSAGGPEGYSYYIDTIKSYPHPIIHVLGNHELEQKGEVIAKALFGEEDFSFDYNDVRFVLMGTQRQGLTSQRLKWLEDKLKSDYPSKKIFLSHEFPVEPFKELFKGIYSLFVHKRKNEEKMLELIDQNNGVMAFYGHLHRFQAKTHMGTAMLISGGGGQRGSFEPRAKQPFSTKQNNFTLVDMLTEEGTRPQGVISCINRDGDPLFMISFYEKEACGEGKGSNENNNETSIQLAPYNPSDNNLIHPPYIKGIYKKYLEKNKSIRK